jgi:hypothetical protein
MLCGTIWGESEAGDGSKFFLPYLITLSLLFIKEQLSAVDQESLCHKVQSSGDG